MVAPTSGALRSLSLPIISLDVNKATHDLYFGTTARFSPNKVFKMTKGTGDTWSGVAKIAGTEVKYQLTQVDDFTALKEWTDPTGAEGAKLPPDGVNATDSPAAEVRGLTLHGEEVWLAEAIINNWRDNWPGMLRRVDKDGIIHTVVKPTLALKNPRGGMVWEDDTHILVLVENGLVRVQLGSSTATITQVRTWPNKEPKDMFLKPGGKLVVARYFNDIVEVNLNDPTGASDTVMVNADATTGYKNNVVASTNGSTKNPFHLGYDSGTGALFFSEAGNHVIRRVMAVGDASANALVMSTIAGIGGQSNYPSDTLPATQGYVTSPSYLRIADDGTIYFFQNPGYLRRLSCLA